MMRKSNTVVKSFTVEAPQVRTCQSAAYTTFCKKILLSPLKISVDAEGGSVTTLLFFVTNIRLGWKYLQGQTPLLIRPVRP
jgi:hypothetical protein